MKTSDLRDIMRIAWQLVRKNGFTMSEALKTAWLNFKLKMKMRYGIVKFYYQKISGEIREAYGTLRADLMSQTKGADRKSNPTVQVYYDSERDGYRCFKIANLVKIA